MDEDQECPICFESLKENPGDEEDQKLLAWYYMQTPCKHNFHLECLRLWMDERLICPVCRQVIPPE